MIPSEGLKLYGLTDNECRAYLALLRFGQQTPAELAPRAAVSRGRVYQVLGEMCRKGFATELPGNTRSFAPVDPQIALGAIVEDRRMKVAETEALLGSLCEELLALEPASLSRLPAIDVLARPEQISQRFEQLQTEAHEEILLFSKAPRVVGAPNAGELEALRRGVRVASVYERAEFGEAASIHELEGFVRAGEEARVIDWLPMKLAIFDRRRALMPLASTHDPALPFTPAVVHDAGLAVTLASAFDHYWERAEPVSLEALPEALVRHA